MSSPTFLTFTHLPLNIPKPSLGPSSLARFPLSLSLLSDGRRVASFALVRARRGGSVASRGSKEMGSKKVGGTQPFAVPPIRTPPPSPTKPCALGRKRVFGLFSNTADWCSSLWNGVCAEVGHQMWGQNKEQGHCELHDE